MKWLTIDKLHEHIKGREMFVVKAFDVDLDGIRGSQYTTDPYCTWHDEQSSNKFPRWPHPFQPTHFCLLPK